MFGHGRHLPAGTPAGDDHEIRDGRFSVEVYDDDIFRLVIVERGLDQLEQLLAGGERVGFGGPGGPRGLGGTDLC
jgi:hypothetical protein